MPDMIAVPQDAPLMIAFNKFKASPEYENARKWAACPEHLEGSLWALFMHGFKAGVEASADKSARHLKLVNNI